MQLTPKCVTYVLLFLFIIFNVVVASPSAEKSKKPRRHAPVRPWMVFVLGTVTACFGYGVLYMFQNEKKRRKQFDSFMKNAQKEFAKLNTVPSSVVQAHERLRVELFVRLFSGSERYASLETADEAVQADGSFSESWQRYAVVSIIGYCLANTHTCTRTSILISLRQNFCQTIT